MAWKFACNVSDIPSSGMLEVSLGDASILIVSAEGEYFAIPPQCPHMEEPLTNGFCDGKVLTCPKHLWQWDIETGAAVGLAEGPIHKYELRKDEDEKLFVNFETELKYEYS